MYPVFFQNIVGDRRVVGKADDINEVFAIIQKFLDDHNYKSYYSRVTFGASELTIDVGSHTEFFFVSKEIKMN